MCRAVMQLCTSWCKAAPCASALLLLVLFLLILVTSEAWNLEVFYCTFHFLLCMSPAAVVRHRCTACTMQVSADSSAASAVRFPARLALQRMSTASTVQRNHASPRSMSRQSVFLGQPAASRPEGWNTSIKPQSPSRCGDQASGRPTTADSSGADGAASPMVTPRHAAVVCKAIGLSKPRVPSLSLAALQADRHHLSVQTSHRKVLYLSHTCRIAWHGIALHCVLSHNFTSCCSHTIPSECSLILCDICC